MGVYIKNNKVSGFSNTLYSVLKPTKINFMSPIKSVLSQFFLVYKLANYLYQITLCIIATTDEQNYNFLS